MSAKRKSQPECTVAQVLQQRSVPPFRGVALKMDAKVWMKQSEQFLKALHSAPSMPAPRSLARPPAF